MSPPKNLTPNTNENSLRTPQTLHNKLSTTDLSLIAMFTSIITICSWISIPATVPFSMQTFGIFLAVGVLGGKRGTLAVFTYLLLGIIGLPVFSGFSGGIGYIMGNTGGYILGFLFSALLMWGTEFIFRRFFDKFCQKSQTGQTEHSDSSSGILKLPYWKQIVTYLIDKFFRKKWILMLEMFLGLLLCYIFGTLWFLSVYMNRTGELGIWTALAWCVFPYIIPDILKIVLAFGICRRLSKMNLEIYIR